MARQASRGCGGHGPADEGRCGRPDPQRRRTTDEGAQPCPREQSRVIPKRGKQRVPIPLDAEIHAQAVDLGRELGGQASTLCCRRSVANGGVLFPGHGAHWRSTRSALRCQAAPRCAPSRLESRAHDAGPRHSLTHCMCALRSCSSRRPPSRGDLAPGLHAQVERHRT